MDVSVWQSGGCHFGFKNHSLFARRGGQGNPLLLIHGFPTSSFDWASVWPALSIAQELHTLDMLGFGLSDKPQDYPYSVNASADQWQAYCLDRQLSDVSILAHDYGNTVAQELLARQEEGELPFRIRKIAFLNGGLFPESTYPILMQKLLLGPLGPALARLSSYGSFAASMRKICTRNPDEPRLRAHWRLLDCNHGRLVLPKIIQYIKERQIHRERWVGALLKSEIPLFLVNGLDDPISGVNIVARWRELLPNAKVFELPGIGHYPQWEAPSDVLNALACMNQE